MRGWFFVIIFLFIVSFIFAIPHQINYQGKVTDASGVGLNGSYDMVFRLFDAATSGTELWSEPHSGVSVTKGLFNIVLGESNPINLPFDAQYYLQIEVEGEVLTPRIPLKSVAYSYRAAIADTAGLVLWSNIQGIPAGFADGVDDVDDADHTIGNEYNTGANFDDATNTLSITDGGGSVTATIDNEADDLSDNVISDLSDVSTTAPSSGEVLKWNGSIWAPATDDTGSAGGSVNISQGTGIICSPDPITGTGTVSFDQSWGDGRYSLSDHTHCGQHWTCSDSGLYIDATVGYGFWGITTDSAYAGVRGDGGNSSAGVYGTSSDSYSGGVVGIGTGTDGVYGNSMNYLTSGVRGDAPTDTTGWGVYGLGDSNDGAVFGVISGFSGSWYQGVAVTGLSPDIGGFFAGDTTAYSWGCLVQTEDENGIGLRAQSLSKTTSGYNYAVYASCSTGVSVNTSDSVLALGVAVFGTNYADSGIGIMGVGNNLGNITVLNGGAGVIGNGNSVGVFGYGDTTSGSSGVLGRSGASDGIGVQGSDDDLVLPGGITNGAGVVGYSDNVGVFGWGDTTTSSYGVYGTSDDDNTGYGVVGSAPYIGVYGQSDGTCLSFSGFGVYGYAADNAAQVDAGVYGGCENTISDWAGYFSGDVYIDGDYTATGTKSAAVKTDDGWHKVYCQESPEIWFEDFGSGKLENGKTYIHLPKDFLGIVTIDNEHPMKVFVQLTDPNCNGVAVIKHSDGFEVVELGDGKSNATFDWRVVAKRKGYENVRYQKIDRKKIRIQHQGIKDIRIDSTNGNRNVSAKLKNIDNLENKSSDRVKFEIKAKNK